MSKTKKINYYYAVGRRKSAVARIRLFKGKGKSLVNNLEMEKYFPGKVAEERYLQPFRLIEKVDKYYVTVKVKGGGPKSQLEAMVAGIAKTFAKIEKESFRQPLKKMGLLTRDSRTRQRRMVGTGGKARRKKQSPKR